LADLDRSSESRRRDAQRPLIDALAEAARLADGLDRDRASDVLWALTGRDLYRMLVVDRGWSAGDYEGWLAEVLVSTLVGPA
ncbi:MAG: TetR/AcrR family transcriptional regulator, partial [Myxococcota bacterium]